MELILSWADSLNVKGLDREGREFGSGAVRARILTTEGTGKHRVNLGLGFQPDSVGVSQRFKERLTTKETEGSRSPEHGA